MTKKFVLALLLAVGGLVGAHAALAHVIVKPNEAGVASFQTFSVGVPSESDKSTTPTVNVRVVLPDGLSEVTPTVKAGWTITTKKNSNDEVTEITWSGGQIPSEQRDDFTFSAQVPATATTLIWKAYQTYKDGRVVSWDQDPSKIPTGEEGTPYSTTNVINDLNTNTSTATTAQKNDMTSIVAYSALVLGLLALLLGFRRKTA